jgi:pyruvate dehydrogenase E2 component (dihydrolipoamide acetyltransferase)
MAKIIGLPKLSPTMDEGILVSWAKKEGDSIEVDELIAEVETDKATVEFRSFDRGVLLKILAPEGTTLKLDQPVAIVGAQGEDIDELVKKAGAGASPPAPDVSTEESREAEPDEEPSIDDREPPEERPHDDREAQESSSREGERVLASPLVRKLARERELDLGSVSGSGPRGRIVKRDLEGITAPSGGRRAAGREGPESIPMSSMRKTIARRLTQSKREIPHYYLVIDVDAEALVDARAEVNELLVDEGVKVSLNDFVIKAAALALRRVPEVNSSVDGDTILRHRVVDVAVAVAVPDGLVTPVLRDADRLSLVEINQAVGELAQKAKKKKLRPEDLEGGTFSVSNLGMYGIDEFSAVINPPQAAILAVSAVRDEPVVRHGMVTAGKKLKLTLSCDHRVVDGAVGASYLKVLRSLLERPVRLLA